jgi:polyhydroxybutyrate depolymerase
LLASAAAARSVRDGGGALAGACRRRAYSGAAPSVTQWAGLDGCSGARTRGADLDLEAGLAGAETKTEVTGGCPSGAAVDLWTLEGGGHIPTFGAAFPEAAWQWLTEHRR